MKTQMQGIWVLSIILIIIFLAGCENKNESSSSGTGYSTSSNDIYSSNSGLSGKLFKDSSLIYNNDLAMVCADFSEAAEDHSGEKIKKVYENYGLKNIRAYGYPDGFVGPFTNIMYSNEGGAASLASCDIDVEGESYKLLVVTARGTMTTGEMAGDVFKGWALDPDKTHVMMNKTVWDNVYDFEEQLYSCIEDYITEVKGIKDSKRLKIIVTGHSLGGAAANLLGAKMTHAISSEREWWSDKIDKSDLYVYTFGAIKVLTSDENLSAGYENIHNIYNYYDSFGPYGTKGILGVSSPYAKYGHTELYQEDTLHYSEITLGGVPNHEMTNYKDALEKNKTGKILQLQCMNTDEAKSDIAELEDINDFSIIGEWVSSGSEGFGQAQPGSTVKFEKDKCNFYSPNDTYVFYRQGGQVYLECTSYIFSETLKFSVEIRDENNLYIKYGSTTTHLTRAVSSTIVDNGSGVEEFYIEGTWKSVGKTGFGQAQPGATVQFDGAHCNFYSPYDEYNLYEDGGKLYLTCKNFLWQDTLKFEVTIIDKDNIIIYYSAATETKLQRINQ